ncbi:MAG: PKD domain-containing protein [candidate division WOR-3 bacterium]|nr:MAG: PKD domain-containing protein [candidate division WOR-3 bacterium]
MNRLKQAALLLPVLVLLAAVGCRSPKPGDPVFAGPGWADVGEECEFVVSATDPDGDDVCFRFDWGNGDTSDWTVFVLSGVQVTVRHFWLEPGSYEVRAQAEDGTGSVSSWSDAVRVNVLAAPGYPTVVVDTVELEDGEVRRMCVSPDGRWLYVSLWECDTVLVFSTSDNSLAATIGQVDSPSDILFSPDAGRAYLLCYSAVLVVETGSHTVVDSITGFWDAEAIGLSCDGQGLFILAYDSIYRVDVTTHAVTGKCAGPGYYSGQLLVHPGGELVYAMDTENGRVRAVRVSDCSVAFDFSAGIPAAYDMALGREASRLYFTSGAAPYLSSVVAATGVVDELMPMDDWIESIVALPRARHLFLFTEEYDHEHALVMDTDNNSLAGTVDFEDIGGVFAFRPDGSGGYVDCWDGILVLGFPEE